MLYSISRAEYLNTYERDVLGGTLGVGSRGSHNLTSDNEAT